MAKITYNIGFETDKSGLDNIKKSFEMMFQTIDDDISRVSRTFKDGMVDAKSEGIRQAGILGKALREAATEGGISFSKMNAVLRQSGTSASQMVAALSSAGMKDSLNTFLTTFAAADRQMITLSARAKEFQRILKQSVQYAAAMNIQRFFIGQVQGAIKWVQQLNAEIVKIGNFAEMSGTQMAATFDHVIKRARDLNVTALDYAQAAFIFYQQGLPQEEIDRRADTVIRAARASLQDITETGKQMTAIWNTYRMSGDEIERAASVAAALSSTTAAQFADIAQGMQIAASGASMLGVAYDSLASIMATVVSVTQQSASIVGNAYKTIFARLTNLRSGGMEDGVDLGRITEQLREFGIDVIDAQGNLRDLDDVIMQLGLTWDNYSQKQQIAIAQVVGGIRQYQHFLALMGNFDMYLDNLATANAEVFDGALQRQYLISLQSIDHAKRMMTEEWRQAFANLFPVDAQRGFYDGMAAIGRVVGELIESFGGLTGILTLAALIVGTKLIPKLFQIPEMLSRGFQNLTFEGQLSQIEKDWNHIGQEMGDNAAAGMRETIQKSFKDQNIEVPADAIKFEAGQIQIDDSALTDLKVGGAVMDQVDALRIAAEYEQKRIQRSGELAQKYHEIEAAIQRGNPAEKARAEQMKLQLAKSHQLELSLLDQAEAAEQQNRKLLKNVEAAEKKGTIMVKATQEQIMQIENEGKLAGKAIARAEAMEKEAEIKAEIQARVEEDAQKEADRLEQNSQVMMEHYQKQLAAMENKRKNGELITAEEESRLEILTQQTKAMGGQKAQAKIALADAQAQTRQTSANLAAQKQITAATRETNRAAADKLSTLRKNGGFIRQNNLAFAATKELIQASNGLLQNTSKSTQDVNTQLGGVLETVTKTMDQFNRSEDGQIIDQELMEATENQFAALRDQIEGFQNMEFDSFEDQFKTVYEIIKDMAGATGSAIPSMEELKEAMTHSAEVANQLGTEVANTNSHIKKTGPITDDAKKSVGQMAQGILATVGAITMTASAFSSLITSIRDGEVTVAQIVRTLTLLTGAIILLQKNTKIFTKIKTLMTVATEVDTAAKAKNLAASKLAIKASKGQSIMNVVETKTWVAKAIAIATALFPLLAVKAAVLALIIAVAALIAIIVAAVAIFMTWRKRQEEAAEASRQGAANMVRMAEAANELAGELHRVANATRQVISAWDDMDTMAQVRAFNELREELLRLNSEHPELNLIIDSEFSRESMERMEAQLRRARERQLEQAIRQTENAIRAQQQGMTRGNTSNNRDTRRVNRGISNAQADEVVSAIQRLGLTETMNLNVNASGNDRFRVDYEELARYFDRIIDDMTTAGGEAGRQAAAAFTREMMDNTDGFADKMQMTDVLDDAREALELTNRASRLLRSGDEGAQRHFQATRNLENEVNESLQARSAILVRIRSIQNEMNSATTVAARQEAAARLEIEQVRLGNHDRNMQNLQRELHMMQQIGREASNLDEDFERQLTVVMLLDQRGVTPDHENWEQEFAEGMRLSFANLEHLIPITDRATASVYATRGAINQAMEVIEEFDRSLSGQELSDWVDRLNEALAAVDDMPEISDEEIFGLSSRQQLIKLLGIERDLIDGHLATYQEIARTTQAELDRLEAQQNPQAVLLQGDHDRLAAAEERARVVRENLDWELYRAEEILAAERNTPRPTYRPGHDNRPQAERDAQAEVDRISAALEEAWQVEIGYYHARGDVLDLMRQEESLLGEIAVARVNAADAAREASIIEMVDTQDRIEMNEKLLGILHDFSTTDFTGPWQGQKDTLAEYNDFIEIFNRNLNNTGHQLMALPPYFLALNDAQQQALISMNHLIAAQGEFQEALQNAAVATAGEEAFQAAVRLEIATTNLGRALAQNANLDFTAMDRYARHLQRIATLTPDVSSGLEGNRRASLHVAAAMMQMNRGIESVDSNLETWRDTLRNAHIASEEFSDAIWEIELAIGDLLGVLEGDVSDSFMRRFMGDDSEMMLDLLYQIKLGSEEAMETLYQMASRDSMTELFERSREAIEAGWKEMDEMTRAVEGLNGPLSDCEEILQILEKTADQLADRWVYLGTQLRDATDIGDHVGENVDEIITELMKLVNAAGMSVAEANREFAKMGFTASFNVDNVPTWQAFPSTYTGTEQVGYTEIPNGDGTFRNVPTTRQFSWPGEDKWVKANKQVLSLSTITEDGGTLAPSAIGTAEGKPEIIRTGGGGGGARIASRAPSQRGPDDSGSPDVPRLQNRSRPDFAEYGEFRNRFEDITTEIGLVTRAMSRLNEQLATAWGPHRIALMREYQSLLERESLLKAELARQAQEYIRIDQNNLREAIMSFNQGDLIGDLRDLLYQVYEHAIEELPDMKLEVEIEFNEEGMVSNMQAVRAEFERLDRQAVANLRRIQQAQRDVYVEFRQHQRLLETLEGDQEQWMKDETERLNEATQYWERATMAAEAYRDAINERFDTIQDHANDLRAAANALQDAHDAMRSNIRRHIQTELDIINYELELNLTINQRDLDRIDWQLSRIGSAGAQQASQFISRAMDIHIRNINLMRDAANDMMDLARDINNPDNDAFWMRTFGVDADFWQAMRESGEAVNMIKGELKEMMHAMEMEFRSAVARVDQTVQLYMSALNRYLQGMDSVLSRFSATMSAAQSIFQAWDTAGGRYRGVQAGIDALELQYRGLVAQEQAAHSAISMWENMIAQNRAVIADLQRAEAGTGVIGAGTDHERDFTVPMGAQIDQLEGAITDLQTRIFNKQMSMADNYAQRVQLIAQMWGLAMEEAIRNAATAMSGAFTDMQQMMKQFNQGMDIQNFFLSPRTIQFEMRQMMRRIENEMDGWDLGDNPELQARHTEWVRRINRYKEEGVQLTQAQLDILKAEFDLELAKAELGKEEEMRQKNTMRLARDASGNWSYVFSDDDADAQLDDIEARIDEIEHNIYQMHRNAADAHSQMLAQLHADLFDFITNINWDLYEANEAYREHVHRTIQGYETLIRKHGGQIEIHNAAISRSFGETALGIVMGTDDVMAGNERWLQNSLSTKNELQSIHSTYSARMRMYVDKLLGMQGEIQAGNDDIVASAAAMAASAAGSLASLAGAVSAAVDSMLAAFQTLKNAIEDLIRLLDELIAKQNEAGVGGGGGGRSNIATHGMANQAMNMANNWGADVGGAGWGSRSDLAHQQRMADGTIEGDYARFMHMLTTDLRLGTNAGTGNIERWNSADRERQGNIDIESAFQNWLQDPSGTEAKLREFKETGQEPRFARGGLASFTGPAWLDGSRNRPELVLNPEDTQNMLAAVRLMRDGVNQNLRGLSSNRASAMHSPTEPTPLDQRVQIDATFPNVTDSNEIQDALNNLINESAQYRVKPRP